MLKKMLSPLLLTAALTGCSADNSENISHLNQNHEIAETVVKNAYSCEDEEFFYVENKIGSRFINFIYGSYSSPLSKRPSSIYSDGVYKVSFSQNEATVQINSEVVLSDCRKI